MIIHYLVVNFLNKIEQSWVAEQKYLKLKQIKKKWEGKNQHWRSVLNCVKAGVGLKWVFKSCVLTTLNSPLDLNENIVQSELIYFRESHKFEVLYNPELFKVNGKIYKISV